MTPEEEAREFHLEVIAAARRRGATDIPDAKEREQVMDLLERLGDTAVWAAKLGVKPQVAGRAMLYYARCIANGTKGGASGIVPEADSGS